MNNDDNPLHEFTHRSGLRVRVPKCYSLGRVPPDGQVIQLVDGDQHIQLNVAVLSDIVAYMTALDWYEGDAMTPASPDWAVFLQILKGKEGIDFRPMWLSKRARQHDCSCTKRPKGWTWDRKENRWPKALAILEEHFPSYDTQDTAAYWAQVGAKCDCAVFFLVGGELDAGFRDLIAAQRRWSTQQEKR